MRGRETKRDRKSKKENKKKRAGRWREGDRERARGEWQRACYCSITEGPPAIRVDSRSGCVSSHTPPPPPPKWFGERLWVSYTHRSTVERLKAGVVLGAFRDTTVRIGSHSNCPAYAVQGGKTGKLPVFVISFLPFFQDNKMCYPLTKHIWVC